MSEVASDIDRRREEMTDYLSIKGAPQEFICQVGAWEKLEEHLVKRHIVKPLVLRGTKSWEAAAPFFPELKSVFPDFRHYGMECSDNARDQFVSTIKELKSDAIIAVGGGKVSDLAKAVGYATSLPVIMLPTLASTCAAYTPLSVIYDKGSMARIDFFSRAVALTLVEPEVILDSPRDLLVAGIGDTLAKWYEADAIIANLKEPRVPVQVAHFAAKSCRDNLLEKSSDALEAHETKVLNRAFIDIIETNLLLAGMVGGFGDRYGRTSGAHTIHDALTTIPEVQKALHGKIVAYAILVQLIIEDKWVELDRLIPFYKKIGLATCLNELGVTLSLEEVGKVSELAARENETIHLLPQRITAEKIRDAIFALEKYRNN